MDELSRTTRRIGHRVRRERVKRGWSVRELARRAQVSPGAVSKLEGGSRVSPSLELGKRLAKALGVTLDYLAGGRVLDLDFHPDMWHADSLIGREMPWS